MSSTGDLVAFAREKMKLYPAIKDDIWDSVRLASSEIEEGGDPVHECEMAEGHIMEMINDYKNGLPQ